MTSKNLKIIAIIIIVFGFLAYVTSHWFGSTAWTFMGGAGGFVLVYILQNNKKP